LDLTARDKEVRRGFFETISRSTVAIGPSKTVPLERFTHGTGVCVEFEAKPFIVTARHVVKELERLGFSPAEFAVFARPDAPLAIDFSGRIPHRVSGLHVREAIPISIEHAIQSDDKDDLAALRLGRESARSAGIRFHVLEETRSSGQVGDGVIIVGLAEEMMVTPGPTPRGHLPIGVNSYALESMVVQFREELLVNYDHRFDPRLHYLADFETGELPDSLQTPRGMSGGGVWLPIRTGPVWYPNVSLVGIQLSWYPRPRLIKVARIERVVDLLRGA